MDSYSKLKIGAGTVFLVAILIIAFAFRSINTMSNGTRGIIGSIELVNPHDTSHREALEENGNTYAIKGQEKGKYFLQFFGLQGKSDYEIERKFLLSKKQFDSLMEGKEYWLDVKVNDPYDWKEGTVKYVYTNDPLK